MANRWSQEVTKLFGAFELVKALWLATDEQRALTTTNLLGAAKQTVVHLP